MVHFHGELVDALSRIAPVVSITAKHAAPFQFSQETLQLFVDTGSGALGTIVNFINPLIWLQVIQILKSSQADIFHLTTSQEWNPLLALFIKILGKPIVFTMHDPEHHLGAPLPMRLSDMVTAQLSDALVTLSKLGKEQLTKRGFLENKVFHLPQGMYSSFLRKSAERTQENAILFFGRIEPYKGLEFLLQAFAQLSAELPGWKLIVAGHGDLSAYQHYLKMESLEIINRYLDDVEVAELMQRASFVVTPYIEATQSAVILVSYAFARPVIATDVGSMSEVVIDGKTGFLIKPNDVEALTQAIRKLAFNSADAERMGNYAYQLAQQEWSWDAVARRHLEMYQETLSSKPT
ncbi:MAG: glycosyltransferase family 4 protein [Anaerolineales bacterium]|nr:glycosyltransferase family 4 protein [Anaerolineales bacterium]MCZ2122742.1 glycosyltransferase family 4 protein [Anaerolineales bacterium]